MSSAKILSGILSGLAIAACSCEPSPPPDYTAFGSPQSVSIIGYAGDAMEPFIGRDGDFLFFNSNGGGPTDKDLFYATFVDGATFQYQGAIDDINTAAVDGAPSLDAADTFYYVSTDGYSPPAANATLHVGTWTGNTVAGSAPLAGLTIPTLLILYFDIEAGADGSTLYLSRGDFTSGGGVPSSADIVVATNSGGGFALDPDSAAVMANVNTDKLEYAPAISADGLELFFTRFDPGTAESRIYRSVRSGKSGAFGAPQLVSAIEGFVEGPAFSPDEKSLYYHRKNTGTELYEIYRVTRP
jgi:hypothetical protein